MAGTRLAGLETYAFRVLGHGRAGSDGHCVASRPKSRGNTGFGAERTRTESAPCAYRLRTRARPDRRRIPSAAQAASPAHGAAACGQVRVNRAGTGTGRASLGAAGWWKRVRACRARDRRRRTPSSRAISEAAAVAGLQRLVRQVPRGPPVEEVDERARGRRDWDGSLANDLARADPAAVEPLVGVSIRAKRRSLE